MECQACKDRGKTWEGSDPICAFGNGLFFSTDNWACATMCELRKIIQHKLYDDENIYIDNIDSWNMRDDMDCATIGVLRVPDMPTDDGGCYLIMTWYKDRGATGKAILMSDDSEPRILTMETANNIIKYFKRGK
jgi:hypothetical protein